MGCGMTRSETDNRIQTQLRLEQAKKQLQKKNNMIDSLKKEKEKLQKDINSKKMNQSTKSLKIIPIYTLQLIPLSSRKKVARSESLLTAQQNEGEYIQEKINQDQQKIPAFVYECPICYRQYDLQHRIPFMICHNQHTLCQLCLDSLIMTSRKFQCPQCRSNMCGKVKNLHICKYLEESNKLKENSEKIKKKAVSQPKCPSKQDLYITVDPNSIGFSNYTFKLPYIKPIKQDNNTFGLFFNQILSQKSLQRIHIQVSPSKSNKIQFGVIDRYFIDHDKVTSPSTGILYSLCDGRVMSTQTKMTNLTEWRDGGKPVMSNTTNRVVMEVDMAKSKIKWLVNEEVYAETIINDYIKTRQTVVYLAMYDRRNEVKLNAIW